MAVDDLVSAAPRSIVIWIACHCCVSVWLNTVISLSDTIPRHVTPCARSLSLSLSLSYKWLFIFSFRIYLVAAAWFIILVFGVNIYIPLAPFVCVCVCVVVGLCGG